MREIRGRTKWCCGGITGALLVASNGYAQSALEVQQQAEEVGQLKKAIEAESLRLEEMKRQMAGQEKRLRELRQAIDQNVLATQRGTGTQPTAATAVPPAQAVAQAEQPTPVGQAPEQANRPPQVAPIFEQPGVLTPKGKFVVEPSLQYAYSSSDRVALVGYTIIPAIVIGLIDIREVKDNTWTGALTARYGVTNRFEIEAKVPYVYRYDTTVARPIGTGSATESIFDTSGKGIGDVELTGRYQFNEGGVDTPYYIGTLRLKSRTGRDPFQVQTSTTVQGFTNGLLMEQPTGSGFYAVEPGITMLYPSDPAVFFGSLRYLHNFKRHNVTLNTDQGDEDLGTIEAGDIASFNFGMGFALNDRSSFSLGYEQNSVGKTKQNGQTAQGSVRVQLGTLLLGYSLQLSNSRTLNVSLGAGLTRDTPDVTLTVRLPMTF